MSDTFTFQLFIFSFLILFSILSSRLFFRFGFPILFIFLVFGMLAGSDGIGGIAFSDYKLAQSVGIFSLCFILFLGGLESDWTSIKAHLSVGIRLSLLGTIFTAIILGYLIHWFLPVLGFLESFLLASIISATDAASVFNIFKTGGADLAPHLKKIIEFESGSNDAVGTLLTVVFLNLIAQGNTPNFSHFFVFFLLQVFVGLGVGFVLGKILLFIMNRIKLGYDGLYLVYVTASVPFVYGASTLLEGSGFLAVYAAGFIIGKEKFIHKKSILRFLNGFVWILQIGMFLCFGLLVFPSKLNEIWWPGLSIAFILCLVARPVAVFLSLIGTSVSWKERHFISWVGLRGASPIILATFPVAAGIPNADILFHIVFFVVLVSLLLQGSTISMIAKWLGLLEKEKKFLYRPTDFDNLEIPDMSLQEMIVPYQSPINDKPLYSIALPPETQVLLVARGDQFLIPSGNTQLKGGDVVWILARDEAFPQLGRLLNGSD